MPRQTAAPLPQPVFGEPSPTQDPSGFTIPPEDQDLYRGIEGLLKKDVVSFDRSRTGDRELFSLEGAWGPRGPDVVNSISDAGRIVFHAVGDSGASSAKRFPSEIRVADALTAELQAARAPDRPSFLYHLGDLVYNFGEPAYYYDQFYDPFRDYPAPIFAIPGNHDSFIVPNTPRDREPLRVFARNFCAPAPVVTPEAGSLHRTAMTQPAVYFSLDAPFVRIIGLFSNALEDPGLISSEGGRWKAVPDFQRDFLRAQLRRIREDRYPGAVILAVHHPPFSYAAPQSAAVGKHAGSAAMLADIDAICVEEKVYPHAFLSGHAHNYQRYTRSLLFGGDLVSVPFVVCGSGGHNVSPLLSARGGQKAVEPRDGADASYLDQSRTVTSKGLVLNTHNDTSFGYLRVIVDARTLTIEFHPVTPSRDGVDTVTVDIGAHRVSGRGAASSRARPASTRAGRARRGPRRK